MGSLLKIRGLSVKFPSPKGWLRAVSELDFDLAPSAITCLVGESGSGKSMVCRAILRLEPKYAILDGCIEFAGENLLAISEKTMRGIRGKNIAMIFQEPMTSLNPVLTVGRQTSEPLRLHLGYGRKEARARVLELFTQVGIPAPDSRYGDYPHQLSGGLRQRVMIAMALACGPMLLLADEPTTALDATIQGQILRLIRGESELRGMAVLLVTHDLGVVADVGDFVGVMYAGALMEFASARCLFARPLHPYTRGLIASQPGRDAITMKRLPAIPGTVPTLENIPAGCPFQPRCPDALPICEAQRPPEKNMDGQRVRCWLYA